MTSMFAESLNGGLGKGFKVILRALGAEIIVAGFILVMVSALNLSRAYLEIASLFGAVFMLYLARGIWKINKIGEKRGEIFTWRRIFALTVLNSGFWIFWLTICAPMAFSLAEHLPYGQVVFMLAFELGCLVITVCFAYIFSKFRPLLMRKNLVASVFKFLALLLAFFALKAIFLSVTFLTT
jgi:threonine/homoserine/homoserine lactone efflux protein